MGRFADTSQYTSEENAFWDEFCSHAGENFLTSRGLAFSFCVQGNELFFDRREKSVTRSSVIAAYRRAQEVRRVSGRILGPKKLSVFGASYLYPVFCRMGVCG